MPKNQFFGSKIHLHDLSDETCGFWLSIGVTFLKKSPWLLSLINSTIVSSKSHVGPALSMLPGALAEAFVAS